jgi:tRNA A-37 threonylcarbamoyl transferase component Bud32
VDDPSTDEPSVAPRGEAAARARAAELIGRVISQRYRIDALLAMGGMGAVYRGHHLLLKKRVAIKVLHPETDNLPELVTRFEREAIAGAHVAHANVAAATDFGQLDDGSYFLVLEYVSGKTLHHLIERGPVPVARAVGIARQLAAGLAAVHAMGIVHRDVKPRNVMVQEKDDLTKLIDFGLAKVPVDRVIANQSVRPPAGSIPDLGAVARAPRRPRLDSLQDSKPRLTGVGMIVGTVAYLAPEAALGMDAVDARADLYALGLILYQMIAGRHPFDADNDAALFAHQRFTPPPSFAIRAPSAAVPPALEAVVVRLLEKDPAARYPTGTAVIEALDAALGPELAAAGLQVPGAGAPPPTARGARSYAPLFVGAIAVLVGVVAALLFNGSAAGPRIAAAPKPAASVAPAAAVPATAPVAVSVVPPSSAVSPAASTTSPVAANIAAAAPTSGESDAANQRTLLLRALRVRDWNGGEAAFLDLVAHDGAMFRSPEMAAAARDLAVALDREGNGDRIFEALTSRLGVAGLDVLYDLVATKGRAGAALRAATVLRRRGVLSRATPELRIAFQLREATCVEKLSLLDRAANEGDGRALVVLQTQGSACFKKHNKALLEAMTVLRSRLNRGQ